ncbi:hypothetical protein PR048_013972 [Dryococelus australis]|uniref:Mutator-like transposase domain-containing protein n=1 Tax=Dryococelus australis TaxID=614101 RepID=A0ABQ9HUL3_9NEOP|nr:hypothetical protein PR048_013972 [Dryococelus australis]
MKLLGGGGAVSVGIGYSQVEELMSVLNIPLMARETFRRRETSMGQDCIIGAETNQLLYLGVKGKFCSMCEFAKTTDTKFKEHCMSIAQRALKYKFYIGDGDSSDYSRTKQRVPYVREVVKAECANHTVKNYRNHSHEISRNLSFPLPARRLPESRISSESRGVVQLKQDIRNGPYHVFGCHKNCREQY